MPRRGQCRCGAVLIVSRTAEGYKQRCPACNAIVRIRSRHKKKRSKPTDVPVPQVNPLPALPAFDAPIPLNAPLPPEPNAASVPNFEPWTNRAPSPPPPKPESGMTWIIVAVVVLVVLGIGGVVGWLIS